MVELAARRTAARDRWVAFVNGPGQLSIPAGSKILDLGCGKLKHPGAVGIDSNPNTDADVIHDLDSTPYPFEDDSFDVIVARHVLEHLERPLDVLSELHRISRDGALIHIVTPHFSSSTSWSDPTHKHHFTSRSFDYLTDESQWNFYSDARFVIEQRALTLGLVRLPGGKVLPLPKLLGIEWLVNRGVDAFERWWAFTAPVGPRDLHLRLRVTK